MRVGNLIKTGLCIVKKGKTLYATIETVLRTKDRIHVTYNLPKGACCLLLEL